MTDGVWWFFLFWAPAYFSDQYGYTSDSGMGIALIFTLYAIVTILSIGGGYLPKYFVEKRGMNPYLGRTDCWLSRSVPTVPGGLLSSSDCSALVIRLGVPTCSQPSVICSPRAPSVRS